MTVTVDFIAFDDDRDACLMVLVEQGPWNGSVDDHLRALQDRVYGCLDAALDGQLAEQFPKAANKLIVIRIDCYSVPQAEVDEFIGRFSKGVSQLPDYSPGSSPWVRAFTFEVNHDEVA